MPRPDPASVRLTDEVASKSRRPWGGRCRLFHQWNNHIATRPRGLKDGRPERLAGGKSGGIQPYD